MTSLNVHPDIDDPFYRYKMPKLIAKVEGSGNGVKTAIVNMSLIAKALNRSPEYTTKFFGCELGAQVQMYPKEDRWIVNGAHEGMKLQSLLSNFIKKFVLCENCENPETNLVITRNEITQKCLACGHSTKVPPGHRLTSYIANHPPQSAGSKDDKKLSKKDRKQKKNQRSEEDIPLEAKIDVLDESEINWSVDISEEASRQRIEALAKGIEDINVNTSFIQSETERADVFFRMVSNNLSNLSNESVQKEIYAEAKKLDLVNKAPLILSELIFSKDILKEIDLNKNLLFKFCDGNERAQKYLLGGVEKIISVFSADLINKIPLIFMELYEKDLIDEMTFNKWAEKPSKKYVRDKVILESIHKHAEPFIKWLEQAEEESCDEEEDNKDLDVIFSFRDEQAVLREEVNNTMDNEDTLDIDAI